MLNLDKNGNIFRNAIGVLLLFYLLQFFIVIINNDTINYPHIVDVVIYTSVFIIYLLKFRVQNLLCFELMFVPICFIALFFDDIISNFLPYNIFSFNISSPVIKNKSYLLQILGYLAFILGCVIANQKCYDERYSWVDNRNFFTEKINYKAATNVIVAILLLLIVYDYYTGAFDSWFYYSNQESITREDRNQGLGHLTCLLLAATVLDFTRLAKQGVSNLMDYLKKCNKFYLLENLFISFMLLISGNRNEMLLIILPLITSYSIMIKKISTRVIVVGLFVGVFAMVVAGMTRMEGVSMDTGELDILSFTRDFSETGFVCDFCVEYTDKNGPIFFLNFIPSILSGIPFVGPKIIDFIEFNTVSSSQMATLSVGSNSGLGSSIFGDLYLNGNVFFLLIYLLFFGYYISLLFNKFYHSKSFNIYKLTFYVYMVSNAVYYARSPWDFCFGHILYVCVIIFCCRFVFAKQTRDL